MSDDWLWTMAFGIMFAVLIGFCAPAIEYACGKWTWPVLLLLAIVAAVAALAITGAHKEEEK